MPEQYLSSCSKIRHVKCSEMYLIVTLNRKKTKASAEERVFRRFFICKNINHDNYFRYFMFGKTMVFRGET